MDIKTKFRVSHKYLLLTLLIVGLVSSLLVCVFMIDGSIGASLENVVHVKNEDELKNAINNTPTGGSISIALDNDITLTSYSYTNINSYSSALIIPANKDITLTSNSKNGFYKLIGAVDTRTIIVEGGGVLRLDGVIVTHKSGVIGCGVDVMHGGGMLYLYSGEISGNTASKTTFCGGGVVISSGGTFVMSGGKITGNTADKDGGGVENYGTFVMSGGEISGNTVGSSGGGVYLYYPSNFTMSGGTISGNTANFGGGVCISYGGFVMSGGEISGNKAFKQGGGVHNSGPDPFVMSGGTISGNSAEEGGGIYHRYAAFTMSGGKITGNVATLGGGVYILSGGVFNRQGGVISGNTAVKGDNDVYFFGNNSDGGSSNGGGFGGNGRLSNGYGFSLRDIVLICVGVAIVIVGVVVVVLFFLSKKESSL